MKFEYTFEGMKLKVLDETFAGKVLEFYSSNREEFDRYEAAKPDNFYTTEYIAATLKAEYAALLKGEFGRFFLFSDDLPGEILGSVSFFGVTSINSSLPIGINESLGTEYWDTNMQSSCSFLTFSFNTLNPSTVNSNRILG